MKKIFKITVFFLTIIIFSSCSTDPLLDESDNQQEFNLKPSDRNNPVVKKLIADGTKYENILEGDKFFHVKDLLFTKNITDYEFLNNEENSTNNKNLNILNRKQYRQISIVSLFRLDISVYLDPSLRNSYLTSLNESIRRYNSISNCGIFLKYSTSKHSTIVIDPKNLGGKDEDGRLVLGRAQFPSKGVAGKQIFINVNNDVNVSSGFSNTKVELLMHEIGHSLGLRHTNWKSNGEGSYNDFLDFFGVKPDKPVHIQGTPSDESDTNSLMWSSINTSFVGFSNNDLIALRNLYPHAYKFRNVNNYYYAEPDGEYESSDDVYADVYRDGSYTNRLTLTRSAKINYYVVTENSNNSNSAYSTPISRTLSPGKNTYFLREVYSQCSPYQGETCTSESLSYYYILRN